MSSGTIVILDPHGEVFCSGLQISWDGDIQRRTRNNVVGDGDTSVDADDGAVAVRVIGLLHRVEREGDEAAASGGRGSLGRRVVAEAQDVKWGAVEGGNQDEREAAISSPFHDAHGEGGFKGCVLLHVLGVLAPEDDRSWQERGTGPVAIPRVVCSEMEDAITDLGVLEEYQLISRATAEGGEIVGRAVTAAASS